MAAGRAIWEFFGERIDLESWEVAAGGPMPVELEPPRAEEPPRSSSGVS
jgi:hypothetical protein